MAQAMFGSPTRQSKLTNQQASSIFADLSRFLSNAGLGELFTVGADGMPGGWLWDKITSGLDSVDDLAVAIEDTDAYKRRFKVIVDLRARAAAGEPVRIPTVGEVRAYEDTVRGMMRAAGLPPSFYDSYQDVQPLMAANLSPVQIEQRLGAAWTRVRDVDPAIRAEFARFYGAEGDAQLAAWFLDPKRTEQDIEKASRAAYTAGRGRTLGIDIDKTIAERIAALPKTDAGINQDLGDISKMQGLTVEGISEATDLTTNDTINAVVFGDGRSSSQLERRGIERQAVGRASTGGAVYDRSGLSGVGSS